MDDSLASPVRVLGPRSVPLGGPRAMTVRRTLPARERSFVGAWCFVDHYGPDEISVSGGMDVAPHPHCGLATVSWLFRGEVEHRDSLGTVAVVRPGEVNLMTAGRGISHSEVSTDATTVLHGVQLWVVLPAAAAEAEPRFEHHVPDVLEPADGVRAQVFVGSLWGSTSPVRVESPLLGAEVSLDAGASVVVPVPEGFEMAVLVDAGPVLVDGVEVRAGDLAVRDATEVPGARAEADAAGGEAQTGVAGSPAQTGAAGGESQTGAAWGSAQTSAAGGEAQTGAAGGRPAQSRAAVLRLAAGSEPARILLLGGTPFAEEVVMWWNFIGRSHEEVAAARDAWEGRSERFGAVEGYAGPTARLAAPALPPIRLKPRGNKVPPAAAPPDPAQAGVSAGGSASGFEGMEAPACS